MENPIEKFLEWLEEAKEAGHIEPTAMNLATVDEKGFPHNRMVLFKKVIDGNFVFFTNYNSNKAKQISKNNRVSLCFYWEKLEKQIRIEGLATKTNAKISDEYFKTRFTLSKIGASVSKQSEVLHNYDEFLAEVKELAEKYKGEDNIPRPAHWGGFAVEPISIEFWQQGDFRLHKRTVFSKNKNGWSSFNLYP
jgi:pyridoxamine 5'-phosphate oxidase